MDCACLVHKICGYYNYNKGVCTQLMRSTITKDDTFEGGNAVPHENVCIRKINLQKNTKIAEI